VRLFEFEAVGANGQRISGQEHAADELSLDASLESRGLLLTESKAVSEKQALRAAKLSTDELVAFTTQLATVTGAGVPLIEGLEGIGKRMTSPAARALVEHMLADLKAGEPLSSAMQPFPKSFPATYLASVKAGEASGSLEAVLTRMASYLEWTRSIRATTVQALIYPATLMLAIMGLISILLFYVLPRLVSLFPAGAGELPWQTRWVLGASNLVRDNALVVGLGVLCLFFTVAYGSRQPAWRQATCRMLMRVPKLGSVLIKLAMCRFASTASTLHSAGCDVFTVLRVSAESCGNPVFKQAFERTIERVRRGQSITDGLSEEPLMDPLLVQMVHVGEKAGALDLTLAKLAAYYDEEVPRTVKRFLSLLEPLLLIGSGILVSFILMAAVLPIFQLYENIG